MKNKKNNKGITLIALIITVVVLLILAAVTIGAVQESDIMSKGKYAADEYNKAKETEGSTLLGYESFIESNLPGSQSSGGNNDEDNDNDNDNNDDNSGNNGGIVIGPNGGLDNPGSDPIQGEGIDGVILNSTANLIQNGTYYGFGEDTSMYLTISDSGNSLNGGGNSFAANITITNGVVSMDVPDISFSFEGNYYETINGNRIIALSSGEFGTSGNDKNSRQGFLFAINTNDLKHDITGSFVGGKSNGTTLIFTEGSSIAVRRYSGTTSKEFYYAGFEDMFYIDERQIRYIGLEQGFGWDGINGEFKRSN